MATADTDFEETVYVTAAAQGDLTTVKNGLDNEVNISTVLARIICAAAYHGQPEIIKFLIARGADINVNEDEETALLAAVCGAQAEMTQLLIEHGADVHVRRYGEGSALHESVRSYLPAKTNDTLGLEIEHGDEDGHTVLHDAASFGRVDLLPGLITRGANVNAQNKWLDTPLDRACCNGYMDAVKFLASHGAEINHTPSGGCAGLGMAASNGQLDIVAFLLDNGAEPLPVSREGPELLCAARSGVAEIVQLLIDHGYSSQGPRSLLRTSFQDSVQVIAQLVDHGVTVDVENTKRQTALHMAVLGKRMKRQTPSGIVLHSRNEVIKLLIEKGVDVNAVDAEGKTAHDIATELGYSDVVEILNVHPPSRTCAMHLHPKRRLRLQQLPRTTPRPRRAPLLYRRNQELPRHRRRR